MRRSTVCLAAACLALLLAGCTSTPQESTRREGCRLLVSADTITDARMQSLDISQDAAGCRITGLAPAHDTADRQQQALAAMATSHCKAIATPGEIRQIDKPDTVLYGFTLLLAPPAAGAGCPARDSSPSAHADAAIDVSSRNMHPPSYPPAAYRAGIEGRVVLMMLVDDDGQPAAILVDTSSGHELLDQAAIRAARNWRFHRNVDPARPGVALARVPVEFKLG
ncbi:energy transducer TonB [Luteimonas sp. BDR2-5]|uniref:energy transducer TonB n=1 Tax=Proluteimonas luteida TaxID=2878685 RepID=UPI001E2B55EE|nr:energy transducer TonB [Luteimonas sp. BDR2-5]MCD9029008.1 energy transducer TonB [Luteimonas sp. BDR2-5]